MGVMLARALVCMLTGNWANKLRNAQPKLRDANENAYTITHASFAASSCDTLLECTLPLSHQLAALLYAVDVGVPIPAQLPVKLSIRQANDP